jgi:DNA ligase-3
MGCQDTTSGRWKTVTKVANGFDDAQLEKINKKIKPLLIPWDTANAHKWLTVDASLVPPFVIDPSNAPVWEIGGAEFTESTKHSAVVAIRFPVITKERPDKDAAHANTLEDVVHIRDVSLARASLTSSGGGAAAAAKAPKKRAAPSILTALGASASKREKVDVKLSGDTMCIDDDDDDDDGEDEWKPASIDAPRGTAASAAPSADSRDFCKYGKGCYRKNPDHIKLFRHGDDRDAL